MRGESCRTIAACSMAKEQAANYIRLVSKCMFDFFFCSGIGRFIFSGFRGEHAQRIYFVKITFSRIDRSG
jgi:hypothetical protein